MSIGERIFSLRKEQNISQIQLAKILNVTRQAVSKWENDLATPDTIRLIQLADVLNTDVEYLATGNHSKQRAQPQVVTVVKPMEIVVERTVEKPVPVERLVEVERIIEVPVEKTVIKKVTRTRYLRNPVELFVIGLICFVLGILIGLLF